MRIIAGRFKGARLPSPPGRGVRPTTDRVREALFSSMGTRVNDADVLDLFAGSGAFGFEALSRGARSVIFVEKDRRVAQALRRTSGKLGIGDEAEVLGLDWSKAVTLLVGNGKRFDIIFVDPPYQSDLVHRVMSHPSLVDLLEQTGILLVENRTGAPEIPVPAGLHRGISRRYGNTEILEWALEDLSGEAEA